MISLKVVDDCAIEVGSSRIGKDAERQFAILLYLATERGKRVPRRSLVAMFWPDVAEPRASHNLRQTLYKLKTLGVALCTEGEDVEIPASAVEPDLVTRFADGHESLGSVLAGETPGEYLPGYVPSFSEPFAEWVDEQRTAVHAKIVRVLLAAIGERRTHGVWAEMETLARAALRLDPLNEEATLARAEAVAMRGSKSRAIEILDAYLEDLGPAAARIGLPASVLKKRIAERLPHRYRLPSDSCFVGRAASMAKLSAMLVRARAGRGSAILLWGEPGIGKTRLAAEFVRIATLQGAQHRVLAMQPSDARRPFALFIDHTASLLELPGGLGCSEVSMRYLRRLTDRADLAEPSVEAQDAPTLYANVKRALLDLMAAISEEQPLVLVIEDVHWLDRLSWEVLQEMILWGAARRIVFVLTSRTPYVTGDVPSTAVKGLEREPLPPIEGDDAEALISSLLDGCPTPPAESVRAGWVQTAGGNPYFLRELASHWVDTGGSATVPSTITGVLEDRLRRLSSPALKLLQACAVLGAAATVDRVTRLLGYATHEMVDAVAEVEASGLIATAASAVLVRHDLIVEQSLALLPATARRVLATSVAEALEREIDAATDTDRLGLSQCVSLWSALDSEGRSLSIMRAYAKRLVEIGRPVESAERLREGRRFCQTPLDHLLCAFEEAQSYRIAGMWELALGATTSVDQISEDPIDPIRGAHLRDAIDVTRMEAQLRVTNDIHAALKECVARAADCGTSRDARASFAQWALIIADTVCDEPTMRRVYAAIDPVLESGQAPPRTCNAIRMIYHTSCGELAVASQHAKELLLACQNVGDELEHSNALRRVAIVARMRGEFDDAIALLRNAARVAEHYRLEQAAFSARVALSYTLVDLGRVAEASREFTGAVQSSAYGMDAMATDLLQRVDAKLALHAADTARVESIAPSLGELRAEIDLRRRCDWASIILRAALLAGKEASVSEIGDDFRSTFDKVARAGSQDFEAETMYHWLARTESIRSARRFLRRYLTQDRREEGVAPTSLLALLGTSPTQSKRN